MEHDLGVTLVELGVGIGTRLTPADKAQAEFAPRIFTMVDHAGSSTLAAAAGSLATLRFALSDGIEILVQEIKHQVTVPTDPQSGQPAGQRVHKPFIFTSALNKATPLMYQALSSGEMLPTVEVNWYRTSVEGKQEHFFTTKLEDATIVDINTTLPHAQNKENADFTQLIEVSMSCTVPE